MNDAVVGVAAGVVVAEIIFVDDSDIAVAVVVVVAVQYDENYG